jgi:hypothetical protein
VRVFESRVLRRLFRCKREEVVRGWRRLYNEKLHNSYSSPNIRVIKLGGGGSLRCVVCMEEIRNTYRILVVNLKGRSHWEDLDVDERIILNWIL